MPRAHNSRRIINTRQVESWRMGIRIGKIRNRLEKHIFGEIEMTATQIRAAEILLRKCIPDLSQTEWTGTLEHKHASEYTDAELLAFLARANDRDRGERTVDEAGGTQLVATVYGVHDSELESGEGPPLNS